jgi:endonuclease G
VLAEFDYERDIAGTPLKVSRFALAPDVCFMTNHEDDLDYTVVAVGDRVSGEKSLAEFGFIPVSNARNKHQLGDFVNIIQHPDGRMKEAVLRENQLVARAGTALHYLADTEEGASGAPVLNVHFALVALHHWGSPHREYNDENGSPISKSVNEGIRASSIYTDLTTLRNTLPSSAKALIDEALKLGLETAPAGPGTRKSEAMPPAVSSDAAGAVVKITEDGTALWQIPLTVAINVGGQFARTVPLNMLEQPSSAPQVEAQVLPGGREVKLELDPDYSKRDGYQPAFLEDVVVPLPTLSAAQRRIAARNLTAQWGDDPNELKYYHYSVVMRTLPERAASFQTRLRRQKPHREISFCRREGRVQRGTAPWCRVPLGAQSVP